ncbi:YqjF family protein [Haloarchaeobius sp. TZWSO28]|uniref:YqjF family protein n=1 Tax=Haloarchaeobius sp. TZWSO28 TaxID=3446119 RepID=UPI003EBBCF0E
MVVPLAMGWRHLLFENYPVDPAVLDAHLPDALDVDTFDGDGWLSVVPFTNVDVRPKGLPARLGFDLPELNLRTYVTCDGEPGVYFFSLDAQGVLGVLGARVFQHLPYFYARIRLAGEDGKVRFDSRRLHPGDRPAHYTATYGPSGEPFQSTEDPLARFLVERYRLYTQGRDESVRYANVDHEPWTLYPAEATVDRDTLFAASGFEHPDTEPVLYYSPGVDVTATRSKRWETGRP